MQDRALSLFPGPPHPGSPAGPGLSELERPREKVGICLSPHSPPDDHYSTDLWLNPLLTWSFINSCSLGGGTYCRPNQ